MRKFIKLIILTLTPFLFSQNKREQVILLNENLANYNCVEETTFMFLDHDYQLALNLKNKSAFSPYDEKIIKNNSYFDYPKYLYIKCHIKNNSKSNINYVLATSHTQKTEVMYASKTGLEHAKIGFVLNNEQAYAKEFRNATAFTINPNEEKTILLKTKIYLPLLRPYEIKFYTKNQFQDHVLNFYRHSLYEVLIFAVLSGGLFLLFFYNVFMHYRTKQITYFYYASYLIFTFANLCLLTDRLQYNLLGNILAYYPLVQEATYTLSFIFYVLFVKSVLINVSHKINQTFKVYLALMITYLVYIFLSIFLFYMQVTLIDIAMAFIFRITTLAFAIIILLQLLKDYNQQYIKYIFIGSLILTISYLLHVLFNILFGGNLLNHYFNLVGSLLEILFFTYALYIKTLSIEKEKFVTEKMSELKSRFFSNISHEFRTPLTLIKSPVQSLQAEINDENQKNKLQLIEKNSTRMLELVDQLLELSKLNSGHLQLILKEGNASAFLNSIIDSFSFQADEKKLTFKTNIEKMADNHYFDKDVIEKIVTNLLSNAFKYTPEGHIISFHSKIENNELNLTVSNSGTTIKSHELPKLFERFYQKDDNQQGVGIGLALVNELVELYKGRIDTKLENDVLSFIVFIPLEKANKNAVVFESNTNNLLKKETIKNDKKGVDLPLLLIVDDNQDVRAILIDVLKENYKILEAADGQQAFKIAKKEIPDCIISDVMMPKMDGFELTKRIKTNELTSFIPIILLTAKTSDESHLAGLKSTADAYLTKPFNNEIVAETVNQLIKERKKLHQRYSQELVLRPVDIVINSVDEKFIEKLQEILDLEIANADFSAEDFAKAAGMSRMQLHRKLKSVLGVTATEFLRTERLKVATELLKKGNGNISEVAYAVGFNDVSYFSKCFKEMYGYTPSEIADSSHANKK